MSADGGVILVGGEALFDVVAGDGEALEAHPGGGPFNAARTIARLEQPVAYLGRLSTDRFGERLERILVEDGVEPRVGRAHRGPDDARARRARRRRERRRATASTAQGTSAPGLTSEAALLALPAGRRDAVRRHARARARADGERARGGRRPALGHRRAGRGRPELPPRRHRRPRAPTAGGCSGCSRARTCVKVSEEDVAFLDPDRDPVKATRALLVDGPAVGLLTRGGDGAIVVTATDAVEVKPPKIEVVDTIGAGDAFAGGFLAWWRERGFGADALGDLDTVVEGAQFACLVAARTCERAGASPPYRREL